MKNQEDAVFDALKRAKVFFDENEASLTGEVDLTSARRRLEETVTRFDSHALEQNVSDRGAQGETAKQQQLRMKLRRRQMGPIAILARRNLRFTPEFIALQMPKASVRGQAFIASARGMADAATVHKEAFMTYGLPETFLDDLNRAITQLETSLTEREKNRTQRVGATKALDVEEKQGRTLLRVLDALVTTAVEHNEALLRAWQAARLIRRRPGATTKSTRTLTSTSESTTTGAPMSTTELASPPTLHVAA